MNKSYLYSLVLDLTVRNEGIISATMGHQAHALFLDLVRQLDPELSARLHDEPNYRPFTVSPLYGVKARGEQLYLVPGQTCRLRLTLLDGGHIWRNLSSYFLETNNLTLRLGAVEFGLNYILTTPQSDASGWAGFTDWPSLFTTANCHQIKFHFASPTAFNLGNKNFALFPEPLLLWDSFLRVWNNCAPDNLKLSEDEKKEFREFVKQNVIASDYKLETTTLRYPHHLQKGFLGSCVYTIQKNEKRVAQLVALAEFARYCGAGCKTTMGMGQLKAEVFSASKVTTVTKPVLREAEL